MNKVCAECEIGMAQGPKTACPTCEAEYHQQCYEDYGCHVCITAERNRTRLEKLKGWYRTRLEKLKGWYRTRLMAHLALFGIIIPAVYSLISFLISGSGDVEAGNPNRGYSFMITSVLLLAAITSIKLNKLIDTLNRKGTDHDSRAKNKQL